MSFIPKLYISVGATGAFFTLRETYEHTVYTRGEGAMGGAVLNGLYQGSQHKEVRSFHHFNLSQDAQEAFDKAQECALQMGLPLSTTRDSLQEEMREIQRATQAQIEAKERQQREREEHWAKEREEKDEEKRQQIKQGIYPLGKYTGKPFAEAPVSYINWLASSVKSFEENSIMRLLAEAVRINCADLLLPVPDVSAVIGSPKQRLTFDVTVIRKASYVRETFYNMEYVYILTMVTKEGVCIVSKSASFNAEVGATLKIKATIKEHSEYQGQAQTVVQRVAVQ